MQRHTLIFSIILLIGCSGSRSGSEYSGNQTKNLEAQLFLKVNNQLGEGPIWNHETQELYWVDINGRKLYVLDPSSKNMQSLAVPAKIGTVVPMNDSIAVVALEKGAYKINLRTGALSLIHAIEIGNAETRMNDGKCDPAGRLWAGSMHKPETKAAGSLYQITEDTLIQRLSNVTISNGLAWTADNKTMYYIDTPTGVIKAYDYDLKSGDITNGRVAVEVPETLGFPDGMAIDAEGKLWVGLWNGNAVARFDPESGDLLTKIEVPAHNVTACAFGGQNLDSLFITTASVDMTEEEKNRYPDAGSVFVAVPGVKGVQSSFYKPN